MNGRLPGDEPCVHCTPLAAMPKHVGRAHLVWSLKNGRDYETYHFSDWPGNHQANRLPCRPAEA